MRQTLQHAWSRRGALAWLLWPISLLYGVAWRLRQLSYRIRLRTAHRMPVPVIVVGNVIAGGAGKTPMVIALVEYLRSLGLCVGVVSRGYGRQADDCRLVSAQALARDVGDEPLLIHQRTGAPVAVAASRVQAARALLAAHPALDLLVCDDGLQHRALHRDIEICLFDERGIGNGFLLPAGPLREPWPRAVDLIVSAGPAPHGIHAHPIRRSLAEHAIRSDGARVALQTLVAGADASAPDILALAGTARPQAFFQMLRARGLQLTRTVALPDHADFDTTPWLSPDDRLVLCTEKDAIKLWRRRPDALAVPLQVELDTGFWTALHQLLAARGSQQLRSKLSSPDGHSLTRPAGLPGHQGPAGI